MKTSQTIVPPGIRVNLIGRVFGELTVVGFVGRRKYSSGTNTIWRCRCSCGATHDAMHGNLQQGTATRCTKCYAKARKQAGKRLGSNNRTHGQAGSPAYSAWACAGGTASEWGDFTSFLADMGERPDGTMLRRLDKSKPHGPGNSLWATAAQRHRLLCEQAAKELGWTDEKNFRRLMSVSRQRVAQLLWQHRGRCTNCGAVQNTARKGLCSSCYEKQLAYKRRLRSKRK